MMRRNCNLELGLFHTPNQQDEQSHTQHQQRQITIFYDGKISVSLVTDLQAKSILMLANNNKKANNIRTPTTTTTTGSSSSDPSSSSSSLLVHQQSHNNNNSNNTTTTTTTTGTGLSMKRSLQRFLQKRKNRIQEASPYHHH